MNLSLLPLILSFLILWFIIFIVKNKLLKFVGVILAIVSFIVSLYVSVNFDL